MSSAGSKTRKKKPQAETSSATTLAAAEDAEHLDHQGQPVAAVSPPGHERPLERLGRVECGRAGGVYGRAGLERLAQLLAQQHVAPCRRAGPEVDHQRMGIAWEGEGERIGPEDPVDAAVGRDARHGVGRVKGNQTLARRPLDVIGESAAEPCVADAHDPDAAGLGELDRLVDAEDGGDVAVVPGAVDQCGVRPPRLDPNGPTCRLVLEVLHQGEHPRQSGEGVARRGGVYEVVGDDRRMLVRDTVVRQDVDHERLCIGEIDLHG